MAKDKIEPDEVNKWFDEISISLKWRKPYEDTWRRNIDFLKGKVYDDTDEADRICVNMVYPYVRVVIPAVYSRNPDVLVNGRKRNDQNDELIRKRAELMQNLLRYYLKELDIKSEVKLCILDAILTGHAWVKTGYETQFTKEEKEISKKNETAASILLKALGVKESEEETEETPTYNEKITSESAWALRASPFDIIVPLLSRRPEELLWIDDRSICSYDEIMNNDDYYTKGLKPSANANQLLAALRGGNYNSSQFGDKLKYIIKHEIWDSTSKSVITLAEGFDKPLLVKPSEYTFLDSKYHPFKTLRFNELIDEFYPQTDIEPAEPQLEELNEVRTQMNNHRKRYNRRYISRPSAFDPQSKADLIQGDDGTIAETTPQMDDKPLQDIIQPLIDAPLPPEVYAVEIRTKDDIDNILGTNAYASEASGGARTATEASIIASQSRFRVEERVDQVGLFVEGILRNLAMISMYFMSKKDIYPILGTDAMYWEQKSSRRDIQREYDFEVAYGSMMPINREVDREQFLKLYVLAKDDPYYDQVKLRLQLARKFDLENPEDWLVPEIAAEIDKQRMKAAKLGLLLPGVEDRSGTSPGVGRVPDLGKRGGGILSDPQASGDVSGAEAEVPGGKGGTALADSPY